MGVIQQIAAHLQFRTLTTACVAMFVSPIITADTDFLSEKDYYPEVPIVSSATRLQQPLSETPTSVTVIDRQMIESSGFFRIADLLRLVPGFQVGLSALDHVPMVTYHGQADAFPRRMQVLVDGRSVFGAVFSNID